MPLDNFALAALTDDTESCIDCLRAGSAPQGNTLLPQLEDTYACLVELQVWRTMCPDVRIVPRYVTLYGATGAQ